MYKWENKSGSGVWKCQLSDDLICVVSWNLNKWYWTKRHQKNPLNNPKVFIKYRQLKGINQKQGSSQNQYKYTAYILQGDQNHKYFFSDNLELIKKLILNHAKNLIRQRMKEYEKILKEC